MILIIKNKFRQALTLPASATENRAIYNIKILSFRGSGSDEETFSGSAECDLEQRNKNQATVLVEIYNLDEINDNGFVIR